MVSRSVAAIEFDGVGMSFGAGAHRLMVLRDLHLEIAAGSFVCLLGRTGCGKSTLLKMVLGELSPTEGCVVVHGTPVTGPGRHCGYVPQKYSLFPDRRVIDNVTFGPRTFHGSAFQWMTASGRQRKLDTECAAYALLDRMGLRQSDGRKYPSELSGGMQQRVAIAQALATNPSVLLMDEAFSALDGATRGSMQELLREVWLERGTTVLFVTHNVPEAILLGSRIVVLARDPLSDSGEPVAVALDRTSPWISETPVHERRHSREFREMHTQLEEATRGEFRSEENEPAQPVAVHG